MHRLIVLNRPTWKDLKQDLSRSKLKPEHDLYFNWALYGGIRLATEDFARLVGEPAGSFRLFDRATAGSVCEFFGAGVRVCTSCAEAGYHSMLMSLEFLDCCPVHGEPLLDKCRCGARFDHTIGGVLAAPGRCRKCKCTVFPTAAMTAHSLSPNGIAAWKSIGDWVLDAQRWIVGCSLAEGEQQLRKMVLFELISNVLFEERIRGPAFMAHVERKLIHDWQHSSASCGPRSRRALGYGDGDKKYVRVSEPWVYSAIARHVRRHVLTRQHRWWLARFQALPDADVLLEAIGRDQAAHAAFQYLLWRMHVEQRIDLRAHSPQYSAPDLDIPTGMCFDGRQEGLAERHIRPFYDWMFMHAAETGLLALWERTSELIEQMCSTGDVYWGRKIVPVEGSFFWIACSVPDYRSPPRVKMKFHCMKPGTVPCLKQREGDLKLLRTRSWDLAGLNREMLLGRAVENPPTSARGNLPGAFQESGFGTGIKRHRLAHVPGRPHFLLGQVGDEWRARVEMNGLESSAVTPRKAIDRLRSIVKEALGADGTSQLPHQGAHSYIYRLEAGHDM